jgi:hypothetical protein
MPTLIEVGLLVLEKKILKKKFSICLLYCDYLPLEIAIPFI